MRRARKRLLVGMTELSMDEGWISTAEKGEIGELLGEPLGLTFRSLRGGRLCRNVRVY